MVRWRAWLRAARPLAHANIAPPIVLGQVLAWATTGHFSMGAAALVHLLGVLDHLAIVFANDVADEAGDRHHDAPTPFSGGSRVLVDGSLDRDALRRAAMLACGAVLAVGLLGAFVLGAPAFAIGAAAALVLLWLYSGAPRLAYRGGGGILQGVGVGVVLPFLGAAAQGTTLPWTWLLPSLVLAVGSHWLTAVPDELADRRAEKRTLAVVRGGLFARRAALLAVVLGTALGAVLLPGPTEARALVVCAVLAASGPAWLVHHDAGPARRRRCLTFVVSLGAAISTAFVGWSLAATR